MKAHLGPPDRVLCSSSKRTRQTAEWVLPKAGFQTPVQYEDGLYLATAGEILTHAQRLDDRVRSVLIIGHNPGMHEVALRLYAKGDPALIELLEIKFPTACLAAFTVPVEHWRELAPHTGTLTHFISPKMLNSEISE